MINARSKIAKQRILAELTKAQNAIERGFRRQIGKILRKQYREAAKLVSGFRENEINSMLTNDRKSVTEVLRRQYRRTANTFSNRIFNELQKQNISYEKKDIINDFWRKMNLFIFQESIVKATSINNATKESFRVILNKGLEEGLSNKEIAKKFRETGKVQTPWRADRIARTETHTVTTTSLNTAAKSSGLMRKKEWISALDSRTRTDGFNHAIANGETVNFDEAYQKTGEPLMFPGDSDSGSAGNVINCRCVEIYHTE